MAQMHEAGTHEAGMLKRWRWRTPTTDQRASAEELARQLGVHSLVARLLCQRGFNKADDARRFLDPSLNDLHDPALLPGAEAAAQRIEQAVRAGQPIVIYGDYDVDGVTASAILWHVLTLAGGSVSTYVPHRVEEGYGLNEQALMDLASERPLIVSVDCGITALGPAQAARDAGVDLIISDHHEFSPAGLPAAHTIVHPRLGEMCDVRCAMCDVTEAEAVATHRPTSDIAHRPSPIAHPPYPFPHLCGAGVAFKLAWQFAKVHCGSQRLPEVFRDLFVDLLSLVALGTVADVVPLVGENRVITRFGLGQIKRTRFAGLNALIDASHLRQEKIDAYHVGFVLGPRLNACGRMGHARDAVRLLTSATEDEAAAIADMLCRANEDRRTTERAISDEAHDMVRASGFDQPGCRAIVLGKEGWHPGVLGIVASRLVESFVRPTVLLNIDNGEAHGSARSVPGVSIHEALEHCADMLNSFGGHAMAAGVRLNSANLDAFRDRLVAFVNERLGPDDLVEEIDLDAECGLGDVNVGMWDRIARLAPFGRSNPSPLLCLRDVQLAEPARRVGHGGKHLRMSLCDPRAPYARRVNAIAFGLGDLADDLPPGARIDIAFSPKVGEWQGTRRAEVHVKDVRVRG
jgi:single-stranded-DNA-specific exonuclease